MRENPRLITIGYKFEKEGTQVINSVSQLNMYKESRAKPVQKEEIKKFESKVIKKSHYHPTIQIYADGACYPNPGGPGGYGAAIYIKGEVRKYHGSSESTTNNIMELTGILKGLEEIKEECKLCTIEILSDSMYALNVLHNWKPKVNKELINKIKENLKECLDYQLTWVRGHANCEGNVLADELSLEYLKTVDNKRTPFKKIKKERVQEEESFSERVYLENLSHWKTL